MYFFFSVCVCGGGGGRGVIAAGEDCRSVWISELEKNHLSDQNLMVSIVGTWNNVEKKAHDEGPACEVPSKTVRLLV